MEYLFIDWFNRVFHLNLRVNEFYLTSRKVSFLIRYEKMKQYFLAFFTSLVIAFITAFVWHIVLFQKLYQELGVLGRIEPNIPLGFIATLLLSVFLSYIYPKIMALRITSPIKSGMRFGITIGILNIIFWVLKFAATQPVSSIPLFFIVESAFELIQLILMGISIAFVYSKK